METPLEFIPLCLTRWTSKEALLRYKIDQFDIHQLDDVRARIYLGVLTYKRTIENCKANPTSLKASPTSLAFFFHKICFEFRISFTCE